VFLISLTILCLVVLSFGGIISCSTSFATSSTSGVLLVVLGLTLVDKSLDVLAKIPSPPNTPKAAPKAAQFATFLPLTLPSSS